MTMVTTVGKLFLSFWNLSLQNLPVGRLTHTILDSAEAKLVIEQAQQSHSLICVSSDDLLAPYKQRSFENQQELCRSLQERFGINIAIEDFLSNRSVDGGMFSVTPLELAHIQADASLLVQ